MISRYKKHSLTFRFNDNEAMEAFLRALRLYHIPYDLEQTISYDFLYEWRGDDE